MGQSVRLVSEALLPAADTQRQLAQISGHLREVSQVTNQHTNGGLNATGTVSLATGAATTTTVLTPLAADGKFLGLTPTNLAAAAALATTYLSSVSKGLSFTLTHAASASARTFNWILLG